MTFDKPINSEHSNLRATLALLPNASQADVQTWFDSYDWSAGDVRALGWTILDCSDHVRDYLLKSRHGLNLSHDARHWCLFGAALTILMESGKWDLLDRTLQLFRRSLLNDKLYPRKTGMLFKGYRSAVGEFPDRLLGLKNRDAFVERYLSRPTAVHTKILSVLLNGGEVCTWDEMTSWFTCRMLSLSHSEEDIRWSLSVFPQHASKHAIRDIQWCIRRMACRSSGDLEEDLPSSNLNRALTLVAYHLNVAPILGDIDTDYRSTLYNSYNHSCYFVRWNFEDQEEFIDPHVPIYTARALLECIREHDMWTGFDGRDDLGRKAIEHILRWKSVPGFTTPNENLIANTLAGGSWLWNEAILAQINERCPQPDYGEIGLLLARAPRGVLQSRLSFAPGVYVQDMTLSIDWAAVAFNEKKEILDIVEDMELVFNRSHPQHLAGLLGRMKSHVNVVEWPGGKHINKPSHGKHWFREVDQKNLMSIVEAALLKQSTRLAMGVDRIVRL